MVLTSAPGGFFYWWRQAAAVPFVVAATVWVFFCFVVVLFVPRPGSFFPKDNYLGI